MSRDPRPAVARRILDEGIVVGLGAERAASALLEMGDALLASPLTAVCVTGQSADALAAAESLRARFGRNMLIGVGGVRTADRVRPALDAGAQFLMAPNFDMGAAMLAQEAGILYIPGVFTPSEAQVAVNAGCHILAVVPNLLGADYVQALADAVPDAGFMPVGGVDVHNIGDFVLAGAVAVRVDAGLLDEPWSMPETILRARALRRAFSAHLREAK